MKAHVGYQMMRHIHKLLVNAQVVWHIVDVRHPKTIACLMQIHVLLTGLQLTILTHHSLSKLQMGLNKV